MGRVTGSGAVAGIATSRDVTLDSDGRLPRDTYSPKTARAAAASSGG